MEPRVGIQRQRARAGDDRKACPLVDVYQGFGGNLALVGPDGLHPSADGYAKIADLFFTAIKQTLETPVAATAFSRSRAPPAADKWRASHVSSCVSLGVALALWLLPASIHIVDWTPDGPVRVALLAPLWKLWVAVAVTAVGREPSRSRPRPTGCSLRSG